MQPYFIWWRGVIVTHYSTFVPLSSGKLLLADSNSQLVGDGAGRINHSSNLGLGEQMFLDR